MPNRPLVACLQIAWRNETGLAGKTSTMVCLWNWEQIPDSYQLAG